MNTLTLRFRQSYSKAIRWSKVGGVVWLLQKTHNMQTYEIKHRMLRCLDKGTTGRAVADFMDAHDLQFIPKFEDHDLKHVILGYGVTPEEEIRMQIYLIGNGNYSLPTLLFASLGLFMPEHWSQFKEDYQKGVSSPSISKAKLKDCMYLNINELRKQYKVFF